MKNVPDCNIGKIHIFFIFTSVVKMSWTHEEQPSESAVNLTTVMTNIVVDESTDHDTPLLPKYYSLFYFFKTLPSVIISALYLYLVIVRFI